MFMKAKYKSKCVICTKSIYPGDFITKGNSGSFHKDCGTRTVTSCINRREDKVEQMLKEAKEDHLRSSNLIQDPDLADIPF